MGNDGDLTWVLVAGSNNSLTSRRAETSSTRDDAEAHDMIVSYRHGILPPRQRRIW